jgi:hypothetical protein
MQPDFVDAMQAPALLAALAAPRVALAANGRAFDDKRESGFTAASRVQRGGTKRYRALRPEWA